MVSHATSFSINMLPLSGECSPCLPFPNPKRFVVACLDPVGMVEDLGEADSQALHEARGITPKKYIFYLSSPLDLPGPDSQWCRYSAYPVAPTLRAIDQELGITPDMVMPIAPNNRYSKGRQPLRTEPPFPFDNCFFWVESSMDVRVRRKGDDGYDDRGATRLSVREHVAMLLAWEDDSQRIAHFLEEKRRLSTLPATSSTSAAPSSSAQPPSTQPQLRPETSSATSPMPPPDSSDDSSSDNTDNMDEHDSDRVSVASSTSSDDLRRYNLFGWDPDPEFAFLPLLEAAVELEEYIDQQEIGDPTEFYKEVEAIKDVLQRFLTRHVESEPAGTSAAGASADGGESKLVPEGAYQYRYLARTQRQQQRPDHDEDGSRKRVTDLDPSPRPAKRSKIAKGFSAAKSFLGRVYHQGRRSSGSMGNKTVKQRA